MAIKGKGRTRTRGRRVIAAPPRPQLVVPKPPFWRRRRFWIVVAILAIAGTATGLLLQLRASHARAFKQREVQGVTRFTSAIIGQFPSDKQFIQPDLFIFYSNLGTDLDNLAKGKLSTKDARSKADELAKSAEAAAGGVQRIKVATFISADFTVGRLPGVRAKGLTRQELGDAQFLISRSFKVYADIGGLMKAAVSATGADRKALVDQAKRMIGEAQDLFGQGFREILGIRSQLGIGGTLRLPSTTPSG